MLEVVDWLAARELPLGYLDPGSGSLLLQLLLGGVAGAAVFLKLFWKKLTSVFRSQDEE